MQSQRESDSKDINENDVKFAREILETLSHMNSASIHLPIPDSTVAFAEKVIADWFRKAAARYQELSPSTRIIDRSLFNADAWDQSTIAWNQGLSLEELKPLILEESMESPEFTHLPSVTNASGIFGDMYRQDMEKGALSGHYNRFLPAKLTMRVLLNLHLNREYYEHLGDNEWGGRHGEDIFIDILREVALSVATFGSKWFRSIDVRSGANKGGEISVGFPDDSESSQKRFMAQFVGSVRKGNSGLLSKLGFIHIDSEGKVEMTHEGWKFATMRNPQIDMLESAKNGDSLSWDEVQFLAWHIENNLPSEWGFMAEVAGLIASGVNRPKALQSELMESRGWDKTASSQFTNGVVSRMQELKFISREKKGREVTYLLEEWGRRKFE